MKFFLLTLVMQAAPIAAQDNAPTNGGLLHELLTSVGLSEAEAATITPLLEPLVEDAFFYELLDTANKAAVASGFDAAAETARENSLRELAPWPATCNRLGK